MRVFCRQILTLLLTMIGACICMYKDGGFASSGMWGSVLAITSTVGAATYQVSASFRAEGAWSQALCRSPWQPFVQPKRGSIWPRLRP